MLYSNSYSNSIIKNIIVTGNEKTKTEVILGIARVKVGDEFTEDTVKNIKRYLDNQRKFEEVEVSYQKDSDNNVIITIKVKDKWSIIGIPYFAYKDSDVSFGFIFLESNLLGYQNSIVLSAIYDKKPDFFFLFSHPRVRNSLFSYVIGIAKKYEEIDVFDKNKITENFTREYYGGFITLKYQFYGEHYIMFSLNNYRYENQKYDYKEKGYNSFSGIFLELDWSSFEGYYAEGNYLGLYYENNLWYSDTERKIAGFKFESFFNPYKKQNIYIGINGFHAFKLDPFFKETIGRDQSFYVGQLRGYKKYQIRTDSGITNNLEYRIPITKIFSTDFILVPFFDTAVSYQEKRKNWKIDSGTGLALRFYLNKVIIPVMEIYFGYGLRYKEYSFGFTLGGRMWFSYDFYPNFPLSWPIKLTQHNTLPPPKNNIFIL